MKNVIEVRALAEKKKIVEYVNSELVATITIDDVSLIDTTANININDIDTIEIFVNFICVIDGEKRVIVNKNNYLEKNKLDSHPTMTKTGTDYKTLMKLMEKYKDVPYAFSMKSTDNVFDRINLNDYSNNGHIDFLAENLNDFGYFPRIIQNTKNILVMEYVDLKSFKKITYEDLANKKVNYDKILKVFNDVNEKLSKLNAGIIFDFDNDNMFISKSGEIKLFGLSNFYYWAILNYNFITTDDDDNEIYLYDETHTNIMKEFLDTVDPKTTVFDLSEHKEISFQNSLKNKITSLFG